MTIYWERCDFCGQNKPVKKCSIIPDFSIDIHCCISCPMWMSRCKSPAWRVEIPTPSPPRVRSPSKEEKKKLIEELTSMLETKKG
ncbi:MAG: hypothetical protein QXK88_04455 [Desulfurococcaceae archaeon]